MRDTRSHIKRHIKLCYVQRNFAAYTQPLDRAYMRSFKSSIRRELAKHVAKFFLEAKSNFERVNLDSSTSVLQQLLLSFVHTAAQNADSPQHRAAGWRFIDWNEVEQGELPTEAKRLLETGELFPRGTAEEPHAPDAEDEATDSEPEAHVLEPLADDHSSDGEDTPTGVEESAAPGAPAVASAPERAAMSLLQRLQAIRIIFGSKPPSVASHQRDSISLRAQKNCLSVTRARVHVRVNRVDHVQESLLRDPVRRRVGRGKSGPWGTHSVALSFIDNLCPHAASHVCSKCDRDEGAQGEDMG